MMEPYWSTTLEMSIKLLEVSFYTARSIIYGKYSIDAGATIVNYDRNTFIVLLKMCKKDLVPLPVQIEKR